MLMWIIKQLLNYVQETHRQIFCLCICICAHAPNTIHYTTVLFYISFFLKINGELSDSQAEKEAGSTDTAEDVQSGEECSQQPVIKNGTAEEVELEGERESQETLVEKVCFFVTDVYTCLQ